MLEGQTIEPQGRLAQFMRVAADFDQADIGFAIDTLIARLDAAGGDPDLEGFTLPIGMQNVPAGLRMDLDDDHEPPAERDGDPSWTEWDGRGGRTLRARHEETGRGAEDDEAAGDELDGNGSEEDFMAHSNWKGEPGCPIADAAEVAWPEGMSQPGYMLGGLAGDPNEDAEPWHLPPLMDKAVAANDHDRVSA